MTAQTEDEIRAEREKAVGWLGVRIEFVDGYRFEMFECGEVWVFEGLLRGHDGFVGSVYADGRAARFGTRLTPAKEAEHAVALAHARALARERTT